MSDPKVTAAHLRRAAAVYCRQSTLIQVERNRESTLRQYDLVSRAAGLGWPPPAVRVIDADLGVSGSGLAARAGFTELTGAEASAVPNLAKLLDPATGLPAVLPLGRDVKYVGAEKVGDVDCHKVSAVYGTSQIQGLLPPLTSAGDVDATIWIGGSDHLIRKAVLSGKFGDNGTDSVVEVDLSGFNGGVVIASPAVTPGA